MAFSHEFSRPVPLGRLQPGGKPRQETFAATAEEYAALAERFGLRDLSGLKGEAAVSRVRDGNLIRVEGRVRADVVQACVVSLQDVPAALDVEFDTYFTETGEEYDPSGVLDGFDLPEEDIPDVMSGDELDVGELAAQYLSLELEPYPRAPGVSLAAQMSGAAPGGNRPFLKALGGQEDK